MSDRSRSSVALAAVFAFGALVSSTAPAMAETVEKSCSSSRTSSSVGKCGDWQVRDTDGGKQDAVCIYASGSHLLTKMTILPPTLFGKYSTKTKVGWRFNARRSSASHPEQPYTVYTSAYHTANASTTSPASLGHGFSKGVYNLPSGPGDNDYYITVDLQWWGTDGKVEGYVNISYDFYKLKRGTTSHVYSQNCVSDF